MKKSNALVTGLLALLTVNAQAGIVFVDDYAEEVTILPGTSLANGNFESTDPNSGQPLIKVIQEKQNHTLSIDISFDDVPGGSSGTILAGTLVNSYLVHFDQFGTSDLGDAGSSGALPGEIQFDSDILGIMITHTKLNASDSELGLAAITSYATGAFRGMELSSYDSYSFSNGGSVPNDYIAFEMFTTGYVDEIRIITAASPVPVPASAWLFSSALLGFSGLRRKKTT